MNSVKIENQQREIILYEKRLQLLKEKKAIQGISTDPSVHIEIEQIEEILKPLYAELDAEKKRNALSLTSTTSITTVPSLREDKFKFLYFVYVKSETDIFARVEADEIKNELNLSQLKTISIGEYLNRKTLIKFSNWYEGIWITHKGVVRVEIDLLGNKDLPADVGLNEIKRVEDRLRLRFSILQYLYEETQGNTFEKVLHTDLAKNLGIDHRYVIAQILPYLTAEGWIKTRTNDSVTITEEGIERVEVLLA